MQTPRMGGKNTLRLLIKGNHDLVDSLLPAQNGRRTLDQGLPALIQEKYGGAFSAHIIHQPSGRSDLLLQQLEMSVAPQEFQEQRLDNDDFLLAQFQPLPFEEPIDVVVLSLEPDITHSPWKHRRHGYLFRPPPHWEDEWSPQHKRWLQEECLPLGVIPVQQFTDNFLRLIKTLKDRLQAHIIVFNCSTVDPRDQVYNYHRREDTFALRVHQLNRALIHISLLEGISLVDVDRLIAELGGQRHVLHPLYYSAQAHGRIREEFLRVLEDIGFFENRPLVMQVGDMGR